MRLPALIVLGAVLLVSGCETPDDDGYYRADDSILTPAWAERSPTAGDIRRAYPQGALEQDVTGRVMLLCTVQPSRQLACVVDTDERPGYGFGEAALSVSKLFLAKPAEPGSPTAVGRKVRIPIRFAIGEP